MRNITLAMTILVGLLAGAGTEAQDYGGGAVFSGQSAGLSVGLVSPAGAVLTLATPAQIGTQWAVRHGVMDFDNRGHVFVANGSSNGFLKIGNRGGITTFIIDSLSVFGRRPSDIAIDQDGDYLVLVSGSFNTRTGYTLSRFDRSTSRETTVAGGLFWTAPAALGEDVETGDYIVADSQNFLLPDRLYRVKSDGSAITTIVTAPSIVPISLAAPDVAIDPATGDIFSMFGGGIHRVDGLGRITTFIGRVPFGETRSLAMDRSTALSPRDVRRDRLLRHANGGPDRRRRRRRRPGQSRRRPMR